MTAITLHQVPRAYHTWDTPHGAWLATADALWQVAPRARVFPIPHCTALAVAAHAVIARSGGERFRLGHPAHPLQRVGLDTTARWLPGWSVEGLALPYGARWASDLQPLLHGLGATWTTAGQAFVATPGGVQALRAIEPQWDASEPADEADDVATATDGTLIWGPGARVWDIARAWSAALPNWPDGVAAARNGRCVVVDILTGEGRWLHRERLESTFAIPLRADAVDEVTLDGEVAVVTTAMGKRFEVEQSTVRRVPGRHSAQPPTAQWCDALSIEVHGSAVIDGMNVAWRRDGALFSWPLP